MNRNSSSPSRPPHDHPDRRLGVHLISTQELESGCDSTDPFERRETVSLADAAVRALQNNLDISISRHNKESRLADIIIEQSKFDPTLSVNGQYARTVNPLNRPVFGEREI